MNSILERKISKFTNSIRQAVKEENWYAALTFALTLPDICGKLEFKSQGSTKRYVQWFNENLLEKYSMTLFGNKIVFLSGKDAYALRCAYLHGGEVDINEQRIKEVLSAFVFVAPDKGRAAHCARIEDQLLLRVDEFCEDICSAVDVWVENNKENKDMQKSADKILEIKTGGVLFPDGVYVG
ncbi:hypothetical protein [Bacillus thuringiensis]|uniref:hypothetical protein n=1 Tax=Bacillus thuringiensis TaxID=1428 RepID=UPI000A3B31DD|nr:hypothetical protein [Bacillus thuringiensis]OUA60427.1 hypothetical protein BK781_08345 [Bacillus thuringiensis serovar aizawai]